jgi:phosphoribosyl 1,2-cyclic phosphodiesterase
MRHPGGGMCEGSRMAEKILVTFWGVRGSYPVPGSDTVHFGGNTTCLEVRVGERIIIIDAGTGIIGLGNKIVREFFSSREREELDLTLFFTHLHHDHTQGLPFFTPLFLGQTVAHFFGPRNFDEELRTVLERAMMPPNFPIDFHHSHSVKEITTIKENNVVLLDTENPKPLLFNKFLDRFDYGDSSILVSLMTDYSHPRDGVFIYKIEHQSRSLVFATDVEGYVGGNSKLIHFARNTDLLIHDAQYSSEEYVALPVPKQGFGHSIAEMAIEVAQKAEVKNLALTHHDPLVADATLKENETLLKKKFKNLFYAREGQTFVIQ